MPPFILSSGLMKSIIIIIIFFWHHAVPISMTEFVSPHFNCKPGFLLTAIRGNNETISFTFEQVSLMLSRNYSYHDSCYCSCLTLFSDPLLLLLFGNSPSNLSLDKVLLLFPG